MGSSGPSQPWRSCDEHADLANRKRTPVRSRFGSLTPSSAHGRRCPRRGGAARSSRGPARPRPHRRAVPAPRRPGPGPSSGAAPPGPSPEAPGGGAGAMAGAGPPLLLFLLPLLLPRPPAAAALRLLLDAAPPFTCSQPVSGAGSAGPGRARGAGVVGRGSGPGGVGVAVSPSRKTPHTSLGCPGRGSAAVPGTSGRPRLNRAGSGRSPRAGCESVLRADVAQCPKSFNQFLAEEGVLGVRGELNIACA